jgi:DNA-binding transcriptional LysR family regulator
MADPLNAHRLQMLVQLDTLGTVRAVAQSLRLSPSAVSAALAALETETGTRLLDRVGRRVELTPSARALVRHARAILDRMATAVAELHSAGAEPVGPVRLAAFSSALRTIAMPVAEQVRQDHPGIQLELLELDPQDSMPALRRGRCDIAITADFVDTPPRTEPDVVVRPLMSDEIRFVTAADGPRARPPDPKDQQPVDLADWADRQWSIDLPGSYLAGLITTMCGRAGFDPIVAGRFTSYQLQLEHVEAGQSVTLLPGLAIDPRYRVRTLPLREPVFRRIHVAVRATATGAARDEVVRRLLRKGTVGASTYGGASPPTSGRPVAADGSART